MVKDLEALVSHLYVLGGRALSAPPPGALVQLAPKRSPRLRERDAFFVLVTPAGQTDAKAIFYEQMAKIAARRYFEHEGVVTDALRDTVRSINTDLYQHNQKHPEPPFHAEIACVVQRGLELYVARTGGAMALLWQEDDFQTFPYEPNEAELTNSLPLGSSAEIEVRLAHYQVDAGHVVAVADASLAVLPYDTLRAAGARGGVQATVGRLKAHGFNAATALLVQFVAQDEPDATPAPDNGAEVDESVAEDIDALVDDEPEKAGRRMFGRRSDDEASTHVKGKVSAEAPRLSRLQKFLEQGKVGQQALVGAASAAQPALDEISSEGRSVFYRAWRRVLRFLQRIVLWLVTRLVGLRDMLDRSLPEPEPGKKPSLPTPIAAGAAILIPVAVVLLVVAFALSTRDETAFERCLSQAQVALEAARSISETGGGDERGSWYGVMEVVNRCMPRRPDDPVLLTVRAEVERKIDEFAGVVRCPMTALKRFDPGADLRGPILRNGVDLYTLDLVRSTIYRDKLNEVGNGLSGEGGIIVQRGAAVGEFTIQHLVDIAWLTDTGVARGSELVALDFQRDSRGGRAVLVTYSPTFPPATAQELIGAERWIGPSAIDTWQGRLYILDPPANQIWRYQPIGGEYPGAPEEYFVGEDRPDISDAVDFAIDETGNVYILMEDGSISKFYGGNPEFFQFSQLPSGIVGRLGSANAMYLDMGLISPGFYVMDSANQTFHETTQAGTFIRSYRAPFGTSFRDLSGIAVDASAENLYVAARDTLYHIPKCK